MTASSRVTPNSVGWYILEGFPWWPVYICDPFKLRSNLYTLGNGHRKILKKARDFPKDYIVVYYFGSHDFSLVPLKKPVLRPWDCPQKDSFVKGHPKHLVKKKQMQEELHMAIQEAEDYLSQPEDIRLPLHMVPSDLDPTLEPPPPELVPEQVDEPMEDVGDVDAEDVEEDAAVDQEDDSGYSDADESKTAGKKKSKKASKEKEKEKEKEKKKTSTSGKDKDKDKDKKVKDKKKAAKSKTHSSSSPSADKKRRKSSSKSKDHDAHSTDGKKRKKGEDGDEGAHMHVHGSSPSKVLKQEPDADVKSEAGVKPEPQEEKRPATCAEDLSSEELSALLEKEIRWILVNCQFEEMTTKTVRKLLEDRLNMDLHKHKPSIKEGVARVIKSMEDEDAAESNSVSNGDAPESVTHSNGDTNVGAEAAGAVRDEERSVTDNEAALADGGANDSRLGNRLEAAKKELDQAMNKESALVDVLASLETLESVERETLAASTLLPKLVALRAHASAVVSQRVVDLAKKWDVEALVPVPKEVQEDELEEIKANMEKPNASHEEILVCLDQLAEMPLTISHLRKTRIALVVSRLRQHANDKVSTKAYDLRRAWIKLMNTEKSDSNASNLKTLKNLNHILEQHAEGEDGVQSAQLKALEQLQGMTLLTQDIIESKIGVSVSKLRKSSNDKIVSAAVKLRKKWKAEAKAA